MLRTVCFRLIDLFLLSILQKQAEVLPSEAELAAFDFRLDETPVPANQGGSEPLNRQARRRVSPMPLPL